MNIVPTSLSFKRNLKIFCIKNLSRSFS